MARPKHIPLRSCAACGQKLAKRELTRIVRTVDGRVEADPTGKVAGRGAYVCPKEECWEQALTKRRLDYVLRSPLTEDDKKALSAYFNERQRTASAGELR